MTQYNMVGMMTISYKVNNRLTLTLKFAYVIIPHFLIIVKLVILYVFILMPTSTFEFNKNFLVIHIGLQFAMIVARLLDWNCNILELVIGFYIIVPIKFDTT
jgi:hypothetical protein